MKISFKKWVLNFAVVLSPTLGFAGQCDQFYPAGIAPVIIHHQKKIKTQELCSSEYVVMYSAVTRGPLWSAEHLSKRQLMDEPERVSAFHVDTRLNPDDRSELVDFERSGYDRGHMTPSGDASNSQAQVETFLLSNMVPQNPNNNRSLHEKIEIAVRNLVKEKGSHFVITGPLFIGKTIEQLNGHVSIPTHIFKLVYDPTNKAAAVYLEKNEAGSTYEIISVAELGKMAGINFLSGIGAVKLLDLPKPHNETEIENPEGLSFENGLGIISLSGMPGITKDKDGLHRLNQLINKLHEIKTGLEMEGSLLPDHVQLTEKTIVQNPFN